MRKPCLLFGCCLLAIGAATTSMAAMAADANAGAPAVLAADGRSNAVIIIPRHPPRPVVFAAGELREHLEKMTGATFPVVWIDPPPHKHPNFVLAVRPEAEWLGRESAQAFTIVESEKPRPCVTITGNTGLAVVYGVYRYLDSWGARWFEPGPQGTDLPELSSLTIRPGARSETPSFLARCIDYSSHDYGNWPAIEDWMDYNKTTHYEYDLWLLRNLTHFERHVHNGHLFDFNHNPSRGAHSLVGYSGLTKKLFESGEERDRFALVTRDYVQQRAYDGAQICFTHPKNMETAIATAVGIYEKMAADGDNRERDLDELMSVSMSLADCGGICECPDCREVAGDGPLWRDRLVWDFMNKVARGLREKVPEGRISLFAPYLDLKRPPEDVVIEPNIQALACRTLHWHDTPEDRAAAPFTAEHRDNVLATQKAGADICTYDYILWRVVPQTFDVLDAIRAYAHDWKLSRQYHLEVMERGPHVYPFLWSVARTAWDKDKDPREGFDYYLRAFYGEDNGKLLAELFAAYQENSRKLNRITFGSAHCIAVMLPDSLAAEYRPKLAAAEAAATARGEDKSAERMGRFRQAFEYQLRWGELARAYKRALVDRGDEAVKTFRAAAAAAREHYEKENLAEVFKAGAALYLERLAKTEFPPVEPRGRELDEDRKLLELFAGSLEKPTRPENLHYLPEVWNFMPDLEDKGLEDGWHNADFDDTGWFKLAVTRFFEEQGFPEYEGRFWYRSKFAIPAELGAAGKRIIFRVGSVDDDGDIYLNGELAYSQKDSSLWDKSWAFDATEFLKPGEENVVAVRGYDHIGAGGLWRPLAIYAVTDSDSKEAKP